MNDFDNQTLEEQAGHILNYIKSEPDQTLIPNGRVRLLDETLKKLQPSRQVNEDVIFPVVGGKLPFAKMQTDAKLTLRQYSDIDCDDAAITLAQTLAYHVLALIEYTYSQTAENLSIDTETIQSVCCKCHEPKRMEDMAIKHRAGENECVDCYANSMRG